VCGGRAAWWGHVDTYTDRQLVVGVRVPGTNEFRSADVTKFNSWFRGRWTSELKPTLRYMEPRLDVVDHGSKLMNQFKHLLLLQRCTHFCDYGRSARRPGPCCWGPKGRSKGVFGDGAVSPPPPHQLGGFGESCKLPCGPPRPLNVFAYI